MIRTSNKVALYARFSSDNQRSESIDAQLRAMEAYCQQHKYVIVKTYIDEARSATTDRRPSFQQMISDSSSHLFQILLVHKLDRFARNRYDSAVYKRELKKNGVQVYSVLENLDDSPESIMMEAVLEGMAEYYSQNLGREVMKGMRENALNGVHTGGKPPLGYDVDAISRRSTINENEAKAVRLIYKMYSDGYGYSPILDALHEHGYKTKNGKDFQKNSLYNILTNPKYQGTYIFNRSSAKSITGTRNTHLHKDFEDIIAIDGGCPAIVERDVYEKVQKRITAHKRTGGRNNAKQCYLLAGKIFCCECGRAMVGNMRHAGRNREEFVTYRCPSRKSVCSNREINKQYMEEYVVDLLKRKILNPRSLKKLAERVEQFAAQDHGDDADAIRGELAKVNTSLKNVADAVADGLLSDALIARLHDLEKQKAELEERLRLNRQLEEKITVDPVAILEQYRAVQESPASPGYREFVGSLIERIDVGRYSVEITLKTGLDVVPELDTTISVRRQEIYERRKAM